jgi:hypothetical protein
MILGWVLGTESSLEKDNSDQEDPMSLNGMEAKHSGVWILIGERSFGWTRVATSETLTQRRWLIAPSSATIKQLHPIFTR